MKANLDKDAQRLLNIRNKMNRKRPEFHRQEWFRYKKLGDSWRKPRGKHSKLREKRGYRQAFVDSGYRGPRKVRGLHPSGFEEKYVTNVKDLEGIDVTRQAVRISSTVGRRKRIEIQEVAKQRGIRILNEVR